MTTIFDERIAERLDHAAHGASGASGASGVKPSPADRGPHVVARGEAASWPNSSAVDDVVECHGEQLHVSERVVVSPCAGVFQPTGVVAAICAGGRKIEVGTLIGQVTRCDVRSPFAGRLMAMLALPGERVRPGQPVAWLRLD